MAVERSELQLVWPPDLFAAEARGLLAAGADDEALVGLLAEAFADGRGEQWLQQIARDKPYDSGAVEDDPWADLNGYQPPKRASEPFGLRATATEVAQLAETAHTLPRHARRLLYRQRQLAVRGRRPYGRRVQAALCPADRRPDPFGLLRRSLRQRVRR